MNSIGGYFEIELNKGTEYHKNLVGLNSGRNCLKYVLMANNFKKVYLPYYSCTALLEPIKKLGLEYRLYNINEKFSPKISSNVKKDGAVLYINYYGILNKNINIIKKQYNNLIVDNAQAFFAKPLNSIDTFYSPRKFFGVPDGGYLQSTVLLNTAFNLDESYNRFDHLLKRGDVTPEFGYNEFKRNEMGFKNKPIKKCPVLQKNYCKQSTINLLRKEGAQTFPTHIIN